MPNHITLNSKDVEYTLRTSRRARRLRLAVHCDGSFVVTAPATMRPGFIEAFILQKSRWVLEKMEYFKQNPTILPIRALRHTRKEYLQHREAARAIAQQRLEHFNQLYNFSFNRISIKNHKRLWGSCSKKRNLNFSYKIALLPSHLTDYIIVHELCHLGEFNHSARFWNLVAKTLPNYIALRKELKGVLY